MYETLRLTELHEERASALERAARYKTYTPRLGAETEAEALDAEIRARVARQEIPPPEGPLSLFFTRLLYGIPDALRIYPRPQSWRQWISHARHAVPVEGCHLCLAFQDAGED